ncbi:MAG: DUF1559 domain-containing protein [Planctomycetaceae bacterium]|jgi:prepilin-type N-terminal cleavage/methylation domain-containing protein|nr:DUF1559 domain-containing protein [Planctomycetaceae bacterium]
MKKAFTLVELLVVIAVISVLIALLIPAVQAVREAGRRTQCLNHQKQLGIALLHYENSYRQFPGWRDYGYFGGASAGGDNIQGGEAAPGNTTGGVRGQVSWFFSILPFCEETALFSNLKAGSDPATSAVKPGEIPEIALVLCPSNDKRPVRGGGLNYVVNGGGTDDFAEGDPWTTDSNVYNGVFLDRARIVMDEEAAGTKQLRNRPVMQLDTISRFDGTSYTLLLSENIQAGFWISDDPADPTTHLHFRCRRNGKSNAVTDNGDGTFTPAPDALSAGNDMIEGMTAFCFPRWYAGDAGLTLTTGDPNHQQDPGNTVYPEAGVFDGTTAGGTRGFISVQDTKQRVFHAPNTGIYHGRVPCWLNKFGNYQFDDDGDNWYNSARPSSSHPGGVLAAFCDGRAWFLNGNISEVLFVQLMTVSDIRSDAGRRYDGGANLLQGQMFSPKGLE